MPCSTWNLSRMPVMRVSLFKRFITWLTGRGTIWLDRGSRLQLRRGFRLAYRFHEQLVGAEARLVIVNLGGDDQFIGARALDEFLGLAPRRLGAADGRGGEDGAEDCPRLEGQVVGIAGPGRRELDRMAAAQRYEGLLYRGREQLRLFIGGRDDRVETEHHIGSIELPGRFEPLAIDFDRVDDHLRREVRGEGIGQAEHRRELRAEQARPENPDRYVEALAGDRADAAVLAFEIAHQLDDVLREAIGVRREIAAHRVRGGLIGAGRPAEPQIDAPGKEAFERPELLGDDQRRVVGQHDSTGADADGRGL